MGLEVFENRVLLQHREAFCLRIRIRRNIEESIASDAGEPDQITALFRLFTFLVEPDADLGAGSDLFANRMNVLVQRDLLALHNQLSRAWTEAMIAFAESPFHQWQ